VAQIVQKHLIKGRPIARLVIEEDHLFNRFFRIFGDVNFFGKQMRIALRNCGIMDPENSDDYLALRGYEALARVLTHMTPEQGIDESKTSGLRGRGGAGFPTGTKWQFTADQQSDDKYVICNADEGDPGAFMDRMLMESFPFRVIEGMAVAAHAVGAARGYLYVRAEYPFSVKRMREANATCMQRGFLGKNILGSTLDLELEVREGAGAFVCGEETALIASIEGQRGMPRIRPPFPAIKGLFGNPTIINNVETLSNLPWIINNGGAT